MTFFLFAVIRSALDRVVAGMNLEIGPTKPVRQALLMFSGSATRKRRRAVNRGEMTKTTDTEPRAEMADLIAKIGSDGDMEAFEQVFRAFGPRVRAYMMRLVRDPQAAEELMQETMMTVWRKAAQFDADKGNAATWIFTIARNLRIDSYRRSKRPDFDPNDPAFVPDADPRADQTMEARDDERRLHAALEELPPEQRKLLDLAFFDEASHSEIAKRLGLPLGTVKSRIRLAFNRLRATLGDRS